MLDYGVEIMGFFTPFDKKVDPKLAESLKALKNTDEVLTNAINFESVFIGSTSNGIHGKIGKVLESLTGVEVEIEGKINRFSMKDEFNKTDFKKVSQDALEEFSQVCTTIEHKLAISVIDELRDLDNVSKAVIAIVDILIHSKNIDNYYKSKLEQLKRSELAVLNLSTDMAGEFMILFKRAGSVVGEVTDILDEGVYSAEEWSSVKKDALKIINTIEKCKLDISKMVPVLKSSFLLIMNVINNDHVLEKEIQEHINILIHGSSDGKKHEYDGEAYTAKDRKNQLFAYNEEVNRKAS
jgi:hypothetical protein